MDTILILRYLMATYMAGRGTREIDNAGCVTVARLADGLMTELSTTKAVEPLTPKGAGALSLEVEPVIDMDGAQQVWDATFPELAGLLDARVT